MEKLRLLQAEKEMQAKEKAQNEALEKAKKASSSID